MWLFGFRDLEATRTQGLPGGGGGGDGSLGGGGGGSGGAGSGHSQRV